MIRAPGPRKSAAFCSGRTVAESPMRCSGLPHRSSRRASESMRCAPRLVSIMACSSSTMTARAVESMRRPLPDVSSRYSDSGVVMRICGGLLHMRARSLCGVSPVRTATRTRCAPSMPSMGRRRFSRMSLPSALSGEMYTTRSASSGASSREIASTNHRNAHSVLPVPVGALISACVPEATAGQPSRCTAVGVPTARENHAAVCGEKSFKASSMRHPSMPLL